MTLSSLILALPFLSLVASPAAAGADRRNPSAPAPDPPASFQLLPHDLRSKVLHRLSSRGSVLLVFEPGDVQLAELQREAPFLAGLDVFPVAVRGCSEAQNGATVERLRLTMSLMSDPRGELAAAFHVPRARGAEPEPSWFLVDRNARVRRLDRRPPNPGLTGVVSSATGSPEPERAVSP